MNMWQRPQSWRPVSYWRPHKRVKWQGNGMLPSWGRMWLEDRNANLHEPFLLKWKLLEHYPKPCNFLHETQKNRSQNTASSSIFSMFDPAVRFPNNGGGGVLQLTACVGWLGQGEEVRTCHCAPFVWTLSLGRAALLGPTDLVVMNGSLMNEKM